MILASAAQGGEREGSAGGGVSSLSLATDTVVRERDENVIIRYDMGGVYEYVKRMMFLGKGLICRLFL